MDIDNLIYDSCWFEIKTDSKRMVMRNHDEFLRKSRALSRVQEISGYRIEKTTSGLKRIRLFDTI